MLDRNRTREAAASSGREMGSTAVRTVLLAVLVLLAGCQAFGNLTTGAMTTTNNVAGVPTPPPHQ